MSLVSESSRICCKMWKTVVQMCVTLKLSRLSAAGSGLSLRPVAGFGEAPLLTHILLFPPEALSPRRRAASGPDTHGGGAQGGAATCLRLCPASLCRQVCLIFTHTLFSTVTSQVRILGSSRCLLCGVDMFSPCLCLSCS